MKRSLALLILALLPRLGLASYSSACVERLLTNVRPVSKALLPACAAVSNDSALACVSELVARVTNPTPAHLKAVASCTNEYAVRAVKVLLASFTDLGTETIRIVASTANPDAARCLGLLATHVDKGITDELFARCAR